MKPDQQPRENPLPEFRFTALSPPPLIRPVPMSAEETRHLANQMLVDPISHPVAPVLANIGRNHSFQGFRPVTHPATAVIPPNIELVDNARRYSYFFTVMPTRVNLHEFVAMLNMISRILLGNPYNGPLPLPNAVTPWFNLSVFVNLLRNPALSYIFEGRLTCPRVFAELCNSLLRSSLQSYPLSVPLIPILLGSATRLIAPGARDENRPTNRDSSAGRTQEGVTALAVRPAFGNGGDQHSRKRQAQNREEDPKTKKIREEAAEAMSNFFSRFPCSEIIDVLCGMSPSPN